ncbi:hypothetical protein MJO28_004761 [Puccinia striiformis f. sp. tritici]|uniref:Uncharacterized protein n=1 Tax=Puccinia striiformis f. sp. tritici TaxID=168172 RepID=A0ACC0EID9_9BASI|nr:hypothetical protein MJO28_004761 [Puccinia striiformis f. sp. tritici]
MPDPIEEVAMESTGTDGTSLREAGSRLERESLAGAVPEWACAGETLCRSHPGGAASFRTANRSSS